MSTYTGSFSKEFIADVKNLKRKDPSLDIKLKNMTQKILDDPKRFEMLKYSLSGYRSAHDDRIRIIFDFSEETLSVRFFCAGFRRSGAKDDPYETMKERLRSGFRF